MGKKNIISASNDTIPKLKVLAKEKESVGRKLAAVAKKPAVIAKEKEDVRIELLEHAKDLEQSRLATLNVLEDLQVEKEALAIAKAKDEALLQNIGEGVVAIDKDGKIILINRASEQMLGWNTERVMGKLPIEVWDILDDKGDLVPEAERPIIRALGGKTTTTTTTTTTTGPTYYYVRKDKTKFPVAVKVAPIITDNKIIGAVEVFRDTTEEKENIQELEKFKLAVEATSDHITITDEDGIILYANRAVEQLTGFTRKEFMGKKAGTTTLWGGLMDADFYKKFWQTIKVEKKNFVGEIKNRRKDGTMLYTMANIYPILNEQGEVRFFVEINRDITKEKEIDRAKTEFVSLASHQLKTPPTAIKLLTERILKGKIGKFSKKQKEYLENISYSNQKTIDIVNALLNVSRIEAGIFTIKLENKNICAIVQNIVNELKPVFNEKKINIEIIYQKNNIILPIDESLFHIVIDNLITNAINYTAEGGKIKVECKEVAKGQTLGGKTLEEDSFAIIITDTGYGIPKDQQSKIFEKFFRGNNVTDKYTNGTGLGLYIVKSILDNSGGLIWFESPARNAGSIASAGGKENKPDSPDSRQASRGGGTTFYVAIPMTGIKSRAGNKKLIS